MFQNVKLIGCGGSLDVTSGVTKAEYDSDTSGVSTDTTEDQRKLDRTSQGTDDNQSLGRELTTMVNSNQHRYPESAPRATSLAAHTQKSILSPWLYVFFFLGSNIISR